MANLKTIQVKTYDDGEVGFDLDEVLEGFTTRRSTVHYYKLEENAFGLGGMILTLYNKNGRKIKLKRKKK